MKKINLVKMSLDLLMAIVFVLLFNKRVIAGLAFHEIGGLAIGLAFVIHKAINWRWIKQVTLNMFGKNVAIKTKIGYIVDILLLIAMGYIIISGLFISKILFPKLRYGNEFFFRNTHISVAYITLALLGIHIGLHWHWVMNRFKNLLGITQKKIVLAYLAKITVILLLVAGIYCFQSTNYFTRVAMIATSFSQSQLPGHGNDFSGTRQNGDIQPGTERPYEFNRPHQNGDIQPDTERPYGFNGTRQNGDLRPGTGRPYDGNVPANVNVLNVFISYLGILAVFTIITYYIEDLL